MSIRLLFGAASLCLFSSLLAVGYMGHRHAQEAARFLHNMADRHTPTLLDLHDLEVTLKKSDVLFSYFRRQPKNSRDPSLGMTTPLRELAEQIRWSVIEDGSLPVQMEQLADVLERFYADTDLPTTGKQRDTDLLKRRLDRRHTYCKEL